MSAAEWQEGAWLWYNGSGSFGKKVPENRCGSLPRLVSQPSCATKQEPGGFTRPPARRNKRELT